MKTVWIAGLAMAATASAFAQSTIYKHVDENGRTTYSSTPMKGATVLALDPTPIPAAPAGVPKKPASAAAAPAARHATLASVEPRVQRARDDERRRILEQELARETQSLASARSALALEQQNPILIAAVRAAQQVADPTPAQFTQIRSNIDKASGRIRGLQATVAEHEKNIEALQKELGALKP